MFILCIQGSPRRDGNTAILISEFADEAERLGAEVKVIEVSDKKVSPCIECGICEEKGFCPIDDDMQELYRLFIKADLVVIGTPIFFYGPTAQLKMIIDRAQALWSRRYILNLSDPGRLWRKGFMIVLGATKGRNLFEGANLVAKYFFDAIGAEYAGYLGYRKIEKKKDILKHPTAIDDVRNKARELIGPFLKRKKVLFVCKENNCMSQMAYAFSRLYFGNKIDARSAGSIPTKEINSLVMQVMAEKGIDMAYLTTQSIKEAISKWRPDIIISIGHDEKYLDKLRISLKKWDIPDPKAESIDLIRNIRDIIERKVKELFKKI